MSIARVQWRSFVLVMLFAMSTACDDSVDHVALRENVGSTPVVLLSTAWCGYCRKLRGDLKRWDVDFHEVDVETSDEGEQAYELVGGRGVPILLIGEDVVHGYSPGRARELLAESGLLPATPD